MKASEGERDFGWSGAFGAPIESFPKNATRPGDGQLPALAAERRSQATRNQTALLRQLKTRNIFETPNANELFLRLVYFMPF